MVIQADLAEEASASEQAEQYDPDCYCGLGPGGYENRGAMVRGDYVFIDDRAKRVGG